MARRLLVALCVGLLATSAAACSEDDVDGASAATDRTESTAAAGAGTDDGGDARSASETTTTVGSEPGDSSRTDEPVLLDPHQVTAEDLPVADEEISDTEGLADGDEVVIDVEADPGEVIYALEARLCAGGVTIQEDSDMRPSRTGKCVTDALSPGSDGFVVAQSEPPYQSVELRFRVGTGSESYVTQFGEPATVTCDRDHPCQLAVKFQVEGGYGFRTYPVEYR